MRNKDFFKLLFSAIGLAVFEVGLMYIAFQIILL